MSEKNEPQSKPKAIILVGAPCSGKTTYAMQSLFRSFDYFNANNCLIPPDDFMAIHIAMRHRRSFIVDDCNGTIEERKRWLDYIKNYPNEDTVNYYQIECHYLKATLSDIKHNSEQRVAEGGRELNKISLIKFKKSLEEPSQKEGFDSILVMNRICKSVFVNKSLFVSLMSIVENNKSERIKPSEVRLASGVNNVLRWYREMGYKLIGIGNFPWLWKNKIDEDLLHDCIISLIRQIHVPIDAVYYSQSKDQGLPNKYLAIKARDDFSLDLSKSIMVGKASADSLFAVNAGIARYVHRNNFFKSNPGDYLCSGNEV